MKKYLTLVLVMTVLAAGAVMTLLAWDSERRATRAAFDVTSDEFVHRVESRLQQHMALITATGAFLEASGSATTRASFQTFVRGLRLETDFEGIRGIGMALMAPASPAGDSAIEALIQRSHDLDRPVWPQTDQLQRAVIVLLEPQDDRNRVALGFDMFSEGRRREAMLKALQSGHIRGSAPVELVQEYTNEKQLGFLLYFPVNRALNSPVWQDEPSGMGGSGFAYAPFRAGDFFRSVLKSFPDGFIEVEVSDTAGDVAEVLFRTPGFSEGISDAVMTRYVVAAGREWTLSVYPGPSYLVTPHVYTALIAFISVLLTVTLAMAMRWQARAMAAVEALNAVSQRTIGEKDLMLQEMKHRIKNSITRILAMARQTAAHSASLEDFTASFFARLQAMANAQEMLTRSRWQRADLRALLETELKQVFGEQNAGALLEGPPVELTEAATQALGLTFHELATNALKYGDYDTGAGTLSVRWRIERHDDRSWLRLDWQEATRIDTSKITKAGFGTRLIDASIRLELGGVIERDIAGDGLRIRIEIPLT
ncbi:CHASE domain-containing protein [Ciceribacter sp. L1K22]|uniref:CHASE domain-containing protein n=1 Tax=Ciceribacter sp. L1K22 TaxID=2820275 RepID=UPI001ABDC1A6|nr:CHASE domain-containing protein [Ciceribacter sp. L1K22]MBO3758709.1 CHASE domain-containing protein [Ciceribacter sp. L1K22]